MTGFELLTSGVGKRLLFQLNHNLCPVPLYCSVSNPSRSVENGDEDHSAAHIVSYCFTIIGNLKGFWSIILFPLRAMKGKLKCIRNRNVVVWFFEPGITIKLKGACLDLTGRQIVFWNIGYVNRFCIYLKSDLALVNDSGCKYLWSFFYGNLNRFEFKCF